jgi:hypothetical protein
MANPMPCANCTTGIHPDHLPRTVCQGSTTVTRFNGGVGLYGLLHERDLRLDRPINSANNSHSDRRSAHEAEWRAHRNGRLPDLDLDALCHLRYLQIVIIDVDDGDIRLRVDATHLRARGSTILERHLYFLGAEHDVGVCHNVAVLTDYNT